MKKHESSCAVFYADWTVGDCNIHADPNNVKPLHMNLNIMENIITLVSGQLSPAGCKKCDAFGIFKNEANNNRKNIMPGAVYGFFVKLTSTEAKKLFNEAASKGAAKLSREEDFKPMFDDVYPLYWGKDKSLGARLHNHLNNPDGRAEGKKSGTGIIRLCAYSSLHGKNIGCYCVVVDDFKKFEKHLHTVYKDLLKTKQSKI